MSYDLYVGLTPQDRAQGTRGSAGACLLAVALAREYGGEWEVAGQVRQMRGEEITWEGTTTMQAQAIIARFDSTKTAKTNRRVKVAVGRGKFRNRAPKRIEQPRDGRVVPWARPGSVAGAVAGGAALAGSAILTAEGDAWAVFAALGLVAAGLVAIIVRNVRAGNRHLREHAEAQKKYVHVQRPATGQAQAAVDERMPAPAPAQPASARLGSERLYTSPDPEPITDPQPAAPAPEPVPATAGGQAA